MDEWRTSAVHQRPYNGALPRLSRKNNLSNEMNDLIMAERVGFEPTVRLPVRRISSAVLSTTQPPLRGIWGMRREAGTVAGAL